MLNPKELDRKIDELFSFRCLPWMVKISNIRRKDKFLAKLKRLQLSIYQLDHSLESNWKVPKKQLKDDWKSINSDLREFGIRKKERERLCRPIRQYERHELRLRRGKTPMDLPMQYLYFYKSCDVKLMRELIYRADDELDLKLSRRDWYTFDLITEVNDDIEDVYEDIHTYNGNRLLFEIHTRGHHSARYLYHEFLSSTLEEFQDRRTGALTKAQKKVKKLTLDIGFETLVLLKKQLKRKKISRISKAIVLKKVY
ncbi:MAG: hypothetical protein HKN87_00205 [Saprospiraceae bacterium]|nr:hypothetical protein [Saprospiraceae bacterium]